MLERLQDILLRERVVTSYQPILRMQEGTIMGFEALSRGPRGSGLEAASDLFEAAELHGLKVELDRLCRRRALLSSGRIPSSAKLFVSERQTNGGSSGPPVSLSDDHGRSHHFQDDEHDVSWDDEALQRRRHQSFSPRAVRTKR